MAVREDAVNTVGERTRREVSRPDHVGQFVRPVVEEDRRRIAFGL